MECTDCRQADISRKKATLEQDYCSRFSHDRMLAILQVGIREMEHLFDRLKPDAVVTFICVTIGEYLAYLIAKKRNIPFLNLRPTRIKNFFFAGESVLEPSEYLKEQYVRMKKESIPSHLLEEVDNYLKQTRMSHAMYEGVVPAGASSMTEGRKEKSGKSESKFP